MDTLSQFLSNLNPALVEMERLGDYMKARKEAFSGAPHRDMLAHHEIEKARFKFRVAANERHILAEQRKAEEQATAERVAAYKQHQTEKRTA